MADGSPYTVKTLLLYLAYLEGRDQKARDPLASRGGHHEDPTSTRLRIITSYHELRKWPDVQRALRDCEAAGYKFDDKGMNQWVAQVCKARGRLPDEVADWSLEEFCKLAENCSPTLTTDSTENAGCGGDEAGKVYLESEVNVPGGKHRMSVEEVAERLERLQKQGEKYTSQATLAKQIGCSSYTVNKAIHSIPSLALWAKVEPVPKVQSASAIVTDQIAQNREPLPEDGAAIREYLERDDISPDERAFFIGLSTEDQLAFLNDPDAHNGTLHPRILGRRL